VAGGNFADATLDTESVESVQARGGELFDLLLLGLVAKELSVTETSSATPEEIVCAAHPRNGKISEYHLLCGLFCWLVVPIFFALARYLQTKCKIFELTTQRFKTTSGVF
jgi:hypothetical protein